MNDDNDPAPRPVAEPPSESLLVSYAGHGFTADGVAYLACGDTQADDLAETSLPLKTLLSALAATKVPFALLLDLRAGLEAEAFSFAPLEAFFAKHPACVCLVSGGDGEKGAQFPVAGESDYGDDECVRMEACWMGVAAALWTADDGGRAERVAAPGT